MKTTPSNESHSGSAPAATSNRFDQAPTTTSASRDYAAIAYQYAKDVVDGKVLAGELVTKSCARHLNDLSRSRWEDGFEFVFSAESAARACEFIEALPHVKGEWAARGEKLRLEPWQVFIVASIFGWVEREDPTLYRFHEVFIEVPRKNGKSSLDAGITLYKFCADDETAAEVYFGATSEEHAKEVGFAPAAAMAAKSPKLLKAFGVKVESNRLFKPADPLAIMKPLIAKPADGQSPSCAAIEEYHQHKSDHLYKTMKTGRGARRNPLMLIITTAGEDLSSPCYALQQDLEKVLDGTITSERRFVIIYTIDKGDDWKTEQALRKANPNWGVSVNPKTLLEDLKTAIDIPRERASFKTKHLDVWERGGTVWIPKEKWDACADPALRIADFANCEAVAAVDLADRVDFADKLLCFTRELEDGRHFYFFARHYLNDQAIDDSAGDHLRRWRDEERILATPGDVTDFVKIADDLVDDSSAFLLREVVYDPLHGAALAQFVAAREEWPVEIEWISVPPNYKYYSPTMKEFEAAVRQRRIHHDGDGVLAWMASNVVCKDDGRGNIYPSKQRQKDSIDGMTAMLLAFHRANLREAPTDPRITVLG